MWTRTINFVPSLFLFPQINACQNENVCSKIIQTNVLIERMELYVES